MVPAETSLRIRYKLEYGFVKVPVTIGLPLCKPLEKYLRRYDHKHPENERYENPYKPLFEKSNRPAVPQREIDSRTRDHK